ncbi:O-methyltransferase [Flavobacterium selenitireducens]|uniref:class I SAM-dependent methyltransferase n=1 Tax=Flavobacterium selenitireducens TaxID=2722704 RepID=UPI00168AFBCC|nr:class I SAM-dependent methyltransferase [Flavobacterium selenitireducens]MBD3583442.1 class I SAM-dependent methyltransferase [Flavobacterium selenitireducens]
MISTILQKIKSFKTSIKSLQFRQNDDIALAQLLKMFDGGIFIPATNWSISPREVLHICNDIAINDRKNIVEFGSGFSTICIARLLQITKSEAKFTSVENNKEWAIKQNGILERMGLSHHATVVYAPIVSVAREIALDGQQKWYDTSAIDIALERHPDIDVVIVDGPFGGLTPFARYSAVPYLKSRITGQFAVFLDDSARPDEKRIVPEWSTLLNAKVKRNERYTCLTSQSSFDVTPY